MTAPDPEGGVALGVETDVRPSPGEDAGHGDAVEPGSGSGWTVTSERLALWVFLALLAVGVVALRYLGSYRWFLGDEWDFLASRSAFNLSDLFRPHNQHWSTLPLLVYRGLFSLFGVRTYVPYQLLVIVLYLATVGMVRWVMRRAGIGPWVSTVCAGALVLFGPGQDDIIWAFQIGFVGAVLLGLTQFILADHPGPIDRRDWLGLGAGLLALMCSGQAPSMVVATGIAVLIKRGWRQAAFHTVPLGIVFLAWFRLSGVTQATNLASVPIDLPPFTPNDYIHWMWEAAKALVMGVGHFTPIAIALAVLLVAGWLLELMTHTWRSFLRRAAIPGSLFLGSVFGMSLTAPQRYFILGNQAASSRYLAVTALLTMPAFAFAANAIIQRWRWMAPAVLALFLIAIPWNVAAFNTGDNPITGASYYRGAEAFVTAIPDAPLARQVPWWVQPNASIVGMPELTVGWLLEAKRAGELPDPTPQEPGAKSQMPVRLGVVVVPSPPPAGTHCQTYTKPTVVKPHVGDDWTLIGAMNVSLSKNGKRTSFPVGFSDASANNHIVITAPDLELLLEHGNDSHDVTASVGEQGSSFQLCT